MFKKAFSLVELVFVIIIIGIMSMVLAPNFKTNTIQQATNQIISHIRYTQHLAMMDNKFSNANQNWFKERWQIKFRKNSSGTHWSYVIFSDKKHLTYSGNPNSKKEVAKNPSNLNEYLIGWDTNTTGLTPSKKLDLTKSFGISNISLSSNCNGSNGQSKSISFDHIGRPFQGNPKSQTSAYQQNRYITSQCIITLTDSENKTSKIAIEPETGYVHQL